MTRRRTTAAPIVAHVHSPTMCPEERPDMQTAPPRKHWTWDEFQRLPEDDGNKYELVHGELWVTPGPTEAHNDIVARLNAILTPYVLAQGLGFVYHPRAVFRVGREVEVEPDQMVRHPHPDPRGTSETAPVPILTVEVVSPRSRRRDYVRKRDLYIDVGISEYWIVDGDRRTITVVKPGCDPEIVVDRLTWAPVGASVALTFDLTRVFGASAPV